MITVMDMASGEIDSTHTENRLSAEEEFGACADEVVNAGWLPLPALQLQTYEQHQDEAAAADIAAFMHAMHHAQE